jgi:hypothetical protein
MTNWENSSMDSEEERDYKRLKIKEEKEEEFRRNYPQEKIVCKNCGKTKYVNKQLSFCSSCGTNIRGEEKKMENEHLVKLQCMSCGNVVEMVRSSANFTWYCIQCKGMMKFMNEEKKTEDIRGIVCRCGTYNVCRGKNSICAKCGSSIGEQTKIDPSRYPHGEKQRYVCPGCGDVRMISSVYSNEEIHCYKCCRDYELIKTLPTSPKTIITCPQCGRIEEEVPGLMFCRACGSSLTREKKSIIDGLKMPPDFKDNGIKLFKDEEISRMRDSSKFDYVLDVVHCDECKHCKQCGSEWHDNLQCMKFDCKTLVFKSCSAYELKSKFHECKEHGIFYEGRHCPLCPKKKWKINWMKLVKFMVGWVICFGFMCIINPI